MELVRGAITDRPWGRTLGRLALRELSGQVTITADGKRYAIAFDRGAVVAAYSPLASDAVVRVAMTSHLISSTQIPQITRRIAAQPDRDDVDVLAEVANLSPEQVHRLRCRVIAQRAARTFAIEQGEFVVVDEVTLAVTPGCSVDIRPIVYLGVRMNVSETRLSQELRELGTHFVLGPDGEAALPRFEFTEQERPILDALRAGTSLPELEATHREIEPRTAQAVIYALVSCEAIAGQPATARTNTVTPPAPPPPPPSGYAPAADVLPGAAPFPRAPSAAEHESPLVTFARSPTGSRTTTPTTPPVGRTATAERASPPARSTATARATTGERSEPITRRAPTSERPAPGRTPTSERPTTPPARSSAPTIPVFSRTPTASRTQTPREPVVARTPTLPRTTTPHRSAAVVRGQIAAGLTELAAGGDYFALLGVAFDAPLDAIRAAYLELARSLHPERLPELSSEETRDASRLFLQVNVAFAVLTDPVKREDYVNARRPKPPAPPPAAPAPPPPPPEEDSDDPLVRAKAAARRGEAALRREDLETAVVELAAAVELAPFDADYAAVLAWAKFCAATDKPAMAAESRKVLERAILKAVKPLVARFYLGRMERMVGRDREALRHFTEILDEQPNHAEAAAEVRVIEQRLAAMPDKSAKKR